MLQSLREYMILVGKGYWMLVVGVGLAIVGGGFDFAQSTGITVVVVPVWSARALWIGGLTMTAVVAPLFAFHRVRIQRDTALAKLEAEPSLWIRSTGSMRSMEWIKAQPSKVAWYYMINLTNASPVMPLGIRSIILEVQRGPTQKALRPITGFILADSTGHDLVGEIPGDLRLEPSESVSGVLAFVEEFWSDDGGSTGNDSNQILIIDSRDKEYRFSTDARQLTWR